MKELRFGIPGRFSVYNALAAISVALELGLDTEILKTSLLELRVPRKV